MLGQMTGSRVSTTSTGGLSLEEVRDKSVRGQPDISALASRDRRSAAVLVWNYHDDDLPAPASEVTLTIDGLPAGRPTVTHYRVDQDHSNAYTVWKAMGSPPTPSPSQKTTLEKAGALQTLDEPRRMNVQNGQLTLSFTLPRQGVSLVKVVW
jgi:xylan 1,4-beta-xylosidase